MKKTIVYVGHLRQSDYETEIYQPLRVLAQELSVEFIFPHAPGTAYINSKELFQNKGCDLFLAEVSYPATGLGMELAYANVYDIPVICIHQKNAKPASSIKSLNCPIVTYENTQDFTQKVKLILQGFPLENTQNNGNHSFRIK